MQLIVTAKKLSKRREIPNDFGDKASIAGTVLQGYKFEGEVVVNVPNPALGKWYKDTDGYYYWAGGLIIFTNASTQKKIIVTGLPTNLPKDFLLGADLSHHNNNPDWDAISKAGVSFVYIKISEGVGTPDSKAKTHADNAQKYGLKIGYYHFCRPDKKNGGSIKSDAVSEANEAINIIMKLPTAHLPLALDLENQEKWNSPLPPAEYALWVETFIARIKEVQGIEPILYSYRAYLDGKLGANHTFGKYKLWLANYSIVDCQKLVLPKGWSDWDIWQFTDKSNIGQSGKMDLSILKNMSIIS